MITKIVLTLTLLLGMMFSSNVIADGFIGIQIGDIKIGIGGSGHHRTHSHHYGCGHPAYYHLYSSRRSNPRYYYAQPHGGHVDIIEGQDGGVYVTEHQIAYNHRGNKVDYYNNPNNNIEIRNGRAYRIPKSSWKYVHPMPGSKFKKYRY